MGCKEFCLHNKGSQIKSENGSYMVMSNQEKAIQAYQEWMAQKSKLSNFSQPSNIVGNTGEYKIYNNEEKSSVGIQQGVTKQKIIGIGMIKTAQTISNSHHELVSNHPYGNNPNFSSIKQPCFQSNNTTNNNPMPTENTKQITTINNNNQLIESDINIQLKTHLVMQKANSSIICKDDKKYRRYEVKYGGKMQSFLMKQTND